MLSFSAPAPLLPCLSVGAAVRPGPVAPEARDRGRPAGGHVGDSLSHTETLEGKHRRRCTTAITHTHTRTHTAERVLVV